MPGGQFLVWYGSCGGQLVVGRHADLQRGQRGEVLVGGAGAGERLGEDRVGGVGRVAGFTP